MSDSGDLKNITDNKIDWLETTDIPQPIIEEQSGGTGNGEGQQGHSQHRIDTSLDATLPLSDSTQSREDRAQMAAIRAELHDADTNPSRIHFTDRAPRWIRTIVKNWAADYRGKLNETVSDSTESAKGMFTKHAKKSERGMDVVDGLRREYRILELLKDSGITPEPLMLKVSPDGTDGNLLMTQVPGQSLEQIAAADDELPARFGEIYMSVRTALDTIHKKGVAVVDVNEGTFVINGADDPGSPITTSVVDFELAAEIDKIISGETSKIAIKTYAINDLGFAIARQRGEGELTAETIKKIERYCAALHTLRSYIGEEPVPLNLLPPEVKFHYDAQLKRVKPALESMITQVLHQRYQTEKEFNLSNLPDSEDVYIKQGLAFELPDDLNTLMLNIVAPYALEDFGISVEPQVMQLLQQDLSPFLEERAP